jgi:hypothetical protein
MARHNLDRAIARRRLARAGRDLDDTVFAVADTPAVMRAASASMTPGVPGILTDAPAIFCSFRNGATG